MFSPTAKQGSFHSPQTCVIVSEGKCCGLVKIFLGYIANTDVVVVSVKMVIFYPRLSMGGFKPAPARMKYHKSNALTVQPYGHAVSDIGIIKNS